MNDMTCPECEKGGKEVELYVESGMEELGEDDIVIYFICPECEASFSRQYIAEPWHILQKVK